MDVRNVTIDDIKTYLNNNGLYVGKHDFDFAEDNDAVKYIGFSEHNHRYLVAFHDDEDDNNFYASIIYVSLGVNGDIVADYGGAPVFESTDHDAVINYILARCN
jgi:hypothetical protein